MGERVRDAWRAHTGGVGCVGLALCSHWADLILFGEFS